MRTRSGKIRRAIVLVELLILVVALAQLAVFPHRDYELVMRSHDVYLNSVDDSGEKTSQHLGHLDISGCRGSDVVIERWSNTISSRWRIPYDEPWAQPMVYFATSDDVQVTSDLAAHTFTLKFDG